MAAMQLKISQYFPSGVRCSRPKGGMTLWLKLPGRMDAGKYFQAAAQQGIGLAPGVIFSNRDKYKSFFRLGCGNQWSEAIDQGLLALGRLAKQMGGE
jgi:DNA-binding transcriptional MocR family regulator